MDKDVEMGLTEEENRAWFKAVVEKANGGDPAALVEMRAFLDDQPEIYRKIGDMAHPLEAGWIGGIAGGNQLIAESVRLEVDRFRAGLLGDHPDDLETMLVNQVVLIHLELQYHQMGADGLGNASKGRATTLLKRLDSAQRRLGTAVRTLDVVRKRIPGRGVVARILAYKVQSAV